MTTIRLELQNEREVRRFLEKIPGKSRRAFSNALNRTGRYARTEAVKEIVGRVNFKKRYLQQRMELIRARSSELTIVILARRRGTLLSRFPFKQLYTRGKTVSRREAGVQVSVKRGRTERLPGAFLVPLKRGKELGAGPTGIALRPKGSARRFEVLHTTSVHDAFRDVLPEVSRRASTHFNTEIRRELQARLREA